MIGETIAHYRILEKPPTTFLRNGTSSGQVGGGGMSEIHPRAFCASGSDFQDPVAGGRRLL